MKLKIIPVEENNEDAKLIMEWRNDPVTRKNSINTKVKVWSEFVYEFYNNYFDNIPLFGTIDNEKFAFISFCYMKEDTNTLKVGINLSPDYRGRGLSVPILKKAMEYIWSKYGDHWCFLAEIKSDNIPSQKLFTKAGFIHTHSVTDLQIGCKLDIYTKI